MSLVGTRSILFVVTDTKSISINGEGEREGIEGGERGRGEERGEERRRGDHLGANEFQFS